METSSSQVHGLCVILPQGDTLYHGTRLALVPQRLPHCQFWESEPFLDSWRKWPQRELVQNNRAGYNCESSLVATGKVSAQWAWAWMLHPGLWATAVMALPARPCWGLWEALSVKHSASPSCLWTQRKRSELIHCSHMLWMEVARLVPPVPPHPIPSKLLPERLKACGKC